MAVGRITLRARKALRSAAAKKGWETRRENRAIAQMLVMAKRPNFGIDAKKLLVEAEKVWIGPRPDGMLRRWWRRATGWVR